MQTSNRPRHLQDVLNVCSKGKRNALRNPAAKQSQNRAAR